jgi:hypothetical protein
MARRSGEYACFINAEQPRKPLHKVCDPLVETARRKPFLLSKPN